MCFYFQIICTIISNLFIRLKDESIDFITTRCNRNDSRSDNTRNSDEQDDYQGAFKITKCLKIQVIFLYICLCHCVIQRI